MKAIRLFLLATVPAAFSFAGIITYSTSLSGPNESPPNGSTATGFAIVTIDDIANTMEVNVTFQGLSSNNTAAHIHCCTAVAGTGTAGVATVTPTFTGFPSGTTAGTYDNIFDMTVAGSYNPAFVTANGSSVPTAMSVLFAGIASGNSYLNIHTTNFGGGEIRGFLAPVPEPGTWLLTLAGFGVLWAAKRKLA